MVRTPFPVSGCLCSAACARIEAACEDIGPSRILANSGQANLVLFLTNLLAIALACKSFLDAALFAGLQIKRVALNFLDNIFRLHLALETAQGVLKGFAFLDSNFCQE